MMNKKNLYLQRNSFSLFQFSQGWHKPPSLFNNESNDNIQRTNKQRIYKTSILQDPLLHQHEHKSQNIKKRQKTIRPVAKGKSRKSSSAAINKASKKQLRVWVPICWMIGGAMVGANLGQAAINENPDHANALFYWCRIYLPLIGASCFGAFGISLAKKITR